MAEVYSAYHPGLDRYVAIKVLHSFLANEEGFLTRFQREAKIVATFRHPNIVQVYDFDFDPESNAYYMVMEFVDGPNLKTRLQGIAQEGRIMPLEEAVSIVTAIADALSYAHQHGMVHRDVKPANIIMNQNGQAILSDFGIAKIVDTNTLTASGAMVGTPAYMAPEQGMGQAGDARADIYSLGVVLYQLMTGSLPFDADTPLGIVLKHINAPLTPPTDINPTLSPGIEAVILRALAKGPNNRYQTAREFATDLENALAGKHIEPISPELAMVSETTGAKTSPGAQDLATPPSQAAPVARSRWGWILAWIAMLALTLFGSATLLTTGGVDRPFAALFSQAATPTPGVTGTPTFTATPDLTATYDANAAQFAIWMATYEATTGVTPTPSPTSTPPPTSTPTPDLTATAIAACVFDMEVVSDRVVWPSVLTPGRRFVKRWTIENTGTCVWPEGTQLVFVSGDELNVVTEPEIEPLSPDETMEVQITLQAPMGYDRYTSVWQLQYGDENQIGKDMEITCRVGPTPTSQPTETPTATPAPEFTPTPMEPLHFSVPSIVDWRDIGGGKWWAQLGLTAWGGDGNYRYYLNVISAETEFFGGTFEIEWENCGSWWGSVYVTSAGEVMKWEGGISYPDPARCQ